MGDENAQAQLPSRITPPLGNPIVARQSSAVRASDPTTVTPADEPAPLAAGGPSVHPIVQGIDRLGDIIGVLVIAYLITHRAIDGYFGVVCILTLLGVNTGLRQWGTRFLQSRGVQGAGLGVLGLLVGVAHGPTASLIAEGMNSLGRGA